MSERASRPKIALLGVPIEIGASQPGTLMGPDALRTAGIGRILDQLGFAVEDHGNMTKPDVEPAEGPPPANAKYYDDDQGLDPRAQQTLLSCWRAPARFRSSWAAITRCRWDR